MVKRVGKFELGKTLGEGTFGKVKLATDTESGGQVAIKVLDKEHILKQNMAEQIKKEISVMKRIKHPNVVNLLDVLVSRTKIYLVLELVTGGELFYKLVNAGRFSEGVARGYFQQLITGVEYCHSQGVCHRDLKPENLLLDANDVLKISDFGLSALHADDAPLLHTTCGTPNYVAPEVLKDSGYQGKTADIWSCGVILYVFLAGFLPFEDQNTEALFRKIQNAEFKYPSWFSKEVQALLGKMLTPDPSKRITLGDIKKDPWFKVNYSPEAIAKVEPAKEPFQFKETEEREEPGKKKTSSPGIVNAFELINMSGAFDVSRMLDRDPGLAESRQRNTSFMSNKNATEIIERIHKVLKGRKVEVKVDMDQFSIKGTLPAFTFHVSLFTITPGLSLVDFRRGKGDVLAFHKLYKEVFVELADLVRKKK